ncbi:sulfite oxidase-like oxidoreductase [Hydrogenobacter hydrogenophilus]|uniref:DMSO/TMAO reductase YedYZ, molybdopterin-dependent catalytic subunit n=1 Tax=Hydrogenobacter hydrogenophilus TaxID=35835 RepID=A0A285P149_9AQUI|nr:sulfite oxidase-like oxidoreductase [Hydrogenobacter hydrogenophilus]SNZ13601.1 DMSO/TMAO reductase YedYZ, molybdopterin-dependent catalytic subunit [Hydrogenobacter hydrogenophilus]
MKRIISSINLRQDRLPPGQRWISTPVVYDIVEQIPDWDMNSYRFKVWGLVENPIEMTYEDLLSLPSVELIADFHCVTRWSVKDILWEGVPTAYILNLVKPKEEARFVMVHCLEGYTTNMPIEYLFEEDSILAYKMNGQIIPKRHGYPLRLVVPKLYAWKSAKYVWGIELIERDMPGFWEQRGYNMRGDPWREERYW